MTDLRMVPVARRRSEQHTTPDHAGSTPTRASRWCHPLGRHGTRTTCTRTERQLNPYFCHLKSGWPRRPPAWEVRFRRFVVFGRPSGGPQALRRVPFALGRPGVGPWTHHPPAVGARRRPAPICAVRHHKHGTPNHFPSDARRLLLGRPWKSVPWASLALGTRPRRQICIPTRTEGLRTTPVYMLTASPAHRRLM